MKSDEELKRDVERELEWEPSVNASAIGVAVRDGVVTLTGEQLNWLLDGYDVWRMKPHEALHFSVFS